MKGLRLGLIGCAGRGDLADYAHQAENNSLIVAGADPYSESQERFLKRLRDKFPGAPLPRLYSDYREMIEKEELDGVFICSPDFLHEEQAVFVLEHRIPVYLEKPIALSIAGADRILESAYRNHTKLMLGHNMRYMKYIRKMKEIIDSGAIGEVKTVWCRHFISYGGDAYFRDWHADEKLSNSLLLQKGAHDIDVIHWLAGGYSERVSGFGNLSVYDKIPRRPMNEKRVRDGVDSVWTTAHWPPLEQKDMYPVISVNDLNMIQMQLDNGVIACYLQCHYTPDNCRNYTVIGTKGRLENFGINRVQVWTERTDAYHLDGDITFKTEPPAGTHAGADPLIVQSFLDILRGKYDVWSSPQAARNSVACGCCGADSIRANGIPMDVPPLPEHLLRYDFARGETLSLKVGSQSC